MEAFNEARDVRGFPYRVAVKTGGSFGAGTDADVSIIFIGDVAISPELYLDDERDNFERNQVSGWDDFVQTDACVCNEFKHQRQRKRG